MERRDDWWRRQDAGDADTDDEKAAIAMYKAAKSALTLGNFRSSHARLEEAIETGDLPDEYVEAAVECMDSIDELVNEAPAGAALAGETTAGAGVFSDEAAGDFG